MTTLTRSLRLATRSDLHLTRKAFHLLTGLLMVGVYAGTGMSAVTGASIMFSLLIVFLVLEALRLQFPHLNAVSTKIWRPIMREHELTQMSGLSFFMASSAIAFLIFPRDIALLSLLYLSFGDPFASIFGVTLGAYTPKFRSGKSWAGFAGAWLVCSLVTWVYLAKQNWAIAPWLTTSLLGGLAGAIAESIPLEIDDNFSIPLISGLLLWVLAWGLGLPIL